MFDTNDFAQLRKALMLFAGSAGDEDAAKFPILFPPWDGAGKAYAAGDRVRYGGLLYRCEQAHTSQADWTPGEAHSLWTRIDDPAEEWPVWRLPAGSTDAYALGAKVSHNGRHWTSAVDANVWEPGAAGSENLWTEEQ